jgi:hypothetical protein
MVLAMADDEVLMEYAEVAQNVGCELLLFFRICCRGVACIAACWLALPCGDMHVIRNKEENCLKY